MKLVTFAVDQDHSLIVTFPNFIQPYRNKPLNLYEIETVPVPIPDTNEQAESYSEAIISKPYIAVRESYYIQLRIQELRMCKKIRFDYYCEELFLVKHQSMKTCESALFYNHNNGTILSSCDFKYTFNISVIPSVLDRGSQIVLANMVNNRRLTCSGMDNLWQPLLSYKYITVSRSILCDCQITSSLSYMLRSIGSCSQGKETPKLYFTANLAFQVIFDYLWTNKTQPPTLSERQIEYPIFLNQTTFSNDTIVEPQTLKELKALVLLSKEPPTLEWGWVHKRMHGGAWGPGLQYLFSKIMQFSGNCEHILASGPPWGKTPLGPRWPKSWIPLERKGVCLRSERWTRTKTAVWLITEKAALLWVARPKIANTGVTCVLYRQAGVGPQTARWVGKGEGIGNTVVLAFFASAICQLTPSPYPSSTQDASFCCCFSFLDEHTAWQK